MSQQIYRHEAQTSTQDGGALNKQMNKQTKQHYECFITYRKFQLYNFERGFRRVYKLEGGGGGGGEEGANNRTEKGVSKQAL